MPRSRGRSRRPSRSRHDVDRSVEDRAAALDHRPLAALSAMQRTVGNAATTALLEGPRQGRHGSGTAWSPAPGAVTAMSPSLIRAFAATRAHRVVGAPVPTVAAPAEGLRRIRTEAAPRRAAGVTSLLAVQPPDLVVGTPQMQAGGRYVAPVSVTASGSQSATSLFPGPGVHDLEPNAGSQAVHEHVTTAASDEIRRGEEEHLLDMEWARHLSLDRAAEIVNQLATEQAPPAASPDEARAAALAWARGRMPAQLQWPDGQTPFSHWIRVFGRLMAVTTERDNNRWHNMSSEFIVDPAEKRRLGVPVDDELQRFIAGTTQVGQHPPADVVRARWESLAAP